MSKRICLTPKQELYFNVIKNYQKAHGTFPNATQLTKAVREAGGKAGASSVAMYATLLLKGAFTGGTVLTDSLNALHSGGNIQPLDVSTLKFAPRQLKKGRPLGGKNKGKASAAPAKRDISTALLALLSELPEFKELLSGQIASIR